MEGATSAREKVTASTIKDGLEYIYEVVHGPEFLHVLQDVLERRCHARDTQILLAYRGMRKRCIEGFKNGFEYMYEVGAWTLLE